MSYKIVVDTPFPIYENGARSVMLPGDTKPAGETSRPTSGRCRSVERGAVSRHWLSRKSIVNVPIRFRSNNHVGGKAKRRRFVAVNRERSSTRRANPAANLWGKCV